MSMTVEEALIEVFGGRRGFLSRGPVLLMQRNPTTEVISGRILAYGPISHTPWGVPKPDCPDCRTNLNVQAQVKTGGKVRWACVCGLVSKGPLFKKPSFVEHVDAGWLQDFYWVEYPIPNPAYKVTWGQKGVDGGSKGGALMEGRRKDSMDVKN
ncbi:hypothetical protein BV22DRAFT_1135943 [Leucogyrophana mollusca]|uniref:Uncharacterized protein n=1 Tax=Leucogyrophana mollusca TaxID=85980 RepID=A0ACB8AU57_9AGAM|nr:hypothetical protein BV22DRAFT_1135943 [Leucogyrophana mollusca]